MVYSVFDHFLVHLLGKWLTFSKIKKLDFHPLKTKDVNVTSHHHVVKKVVISLINEHWLFS